MATKKKTAAPKKKTPTTKPTKKVEKTPKPHWSWALTSVGPDQRMACEDARTWAEKQPSYAEAWEACTNPGWLRWLLDMTIGRKNTNTQTRIADFVVSLRNKLGVMAMRDCECPSCLDGLSKPRARKKRAEACREIRRAFARPALRLSGRVLR